MTAREVLAEVLKFIQQVLETDSIRISETAGDEDRKQWFLCDQLREVAAYLLEQLGPAAQLGTRLFNAIWRLFSATAVEVVVFRRIDGVDCVFLSRRKPGEAYAGLLHSIGTLIWAIDRSIKALIERLSERKYGDKGMLRLLTKQPIEAEIIEEERGTMGYMLYLGELTGDPGSDKGSWVPVAEALTMGDREIVPHHPGLIRAAYRVWREMQMEPMDGWDLGYIVQAVREEGPEVFPAGELQWARATALKLLAPGAELGPEVWDRVE